MNQTFQTEKKIIMNRLADKMKKKVTIKRISTFKKFFNGNTEYLDDFSSMTPNQKKKRIKLLWGKLRMIVLMTSAVSMLKKMNETNQEEEWYLTLGLDYDEEKVKLKNSWSFDKSWKPY